MHIAIAALKQRFPRFRQIVHGAPIVLFANGNGHCERMAKLRLQSVYLIFINDKPKAELDALPADTARQLRASSGRCRRSGLKRVHKPATGSNNGHVATDRVRLSLIGI
jgi:hypothetical protein